MTERNPFAPGFADLPDSVPVFPLPGALLLPRGRLPLHIFEPRYLAMTQDALATDRLIGMIQPREDEQPGHDPALYGTGCVGRIVQFAETDDGRYYITLAGIARFDVGRELEPVRGYRRVVADWSGYRADFDEPEIPGLDRERLRLGLKAFLAHRSITADWEAVDKADDDQLVVTLAMMCPFAPNEKQALLEAASPAARADALMALLEMSQHQDGEQAVVRH